MTPWLLLLGLFGLADIPLVLGIAYPTISQIGMLLTVVVLIVALVDRAISVRPNVVDVRRETGDGMSVGARNPVKIWLRNRSRTTSRIEEYDESPQPSALFNIPFTIKLPPERTRYGVYHVEPHPRGKRQFGRVFLRCRSRLALWTLWDERPLERPVRIYPDIQAVHAVELPARQNRLAAAGVRLSRIRGRGNEFDRLRQYRREDEYRSNDWKATARHGELISHEYVVERNQNILFVLDCGRFMCNELDGITHFDRALNAVILLSYVALRQGDMVGVLACSNRVERWVPPVRGAAAIQTLIRQTYDLTPNYNASDYSLVVEELRRRHRKRSLVVFVTHALDEFHMNSISQHLRQIRSPHLVLDAFLRNVPLYDRLNVIPQTDLEAFQIAAAAEMVAAQTLQVAKLEKSGVLVVDTLPEKLSAQLISQDLEIKEQSRMALSYLRLLCTVSYAFCILARRMARGSCMSL